MGSSELLQEARRALGIDQLVLAVHDASFPSAEGEDVGRGSPYSRGALDLYQMAASLGFTGAQLGPQGETTRGNRSPYDGTAFARSLLSLDLPSLARDPVLGALVDRQLMSCLVANRPSGDGRVHYAYAFDAMRAAVEEMRRAFEREAPGPLRERFEAFRRSNADWLDHDEAYEKATGALEMGDAFAFGQFLIHTQHATARATTPQAGWTLYGDLQVGLSICDRWGREASFLSGYAMGAPPSRTDPEGQAWGYPVADPRSGDVSLLDRRVAKMVSETDGLRIDHPHGLVCPWVYDVAAPDPLLAVRNGARLFDSPDLPDHPRLAQWAIARPEQIDHSVPRYADPWVRELDEAQVAAYATRFDRIVEGIAAHGGDPRRVMCEVLSTQPYPLRRVMERHGLGRFKVTQKSNPDDATDVYRSENARSADWIMVGNHDTLPLLMVVDRWRERGALPSRARYLADRLGLDAASLEADPSRVVQAMFAELFVSPARNVMVFVPDLLGERAVYNRPGVVDDVNWTWRVPNDFRAVYRANVARGEAMDVPRAMAMALRAKSDATRSKGELIEALETLPLPE